MSEKYKDKFKYLNYVNHLLILVSMVTVSVPIFAFASLVCFPVGIMSFAVGIKIQELKCISQLSRKRKTAMIK